MVNNNLSDTALIEVAYLLSPLKYLNTPGKVVLFMRKLGYDVPATDLVSSLGGISGVIGGLIAATQKLIEADTDSKRLTELADLLPIVKQAFMEANKLEVALKAVPGLAADFIIKAPLNDLPKRLLDYLIFLCLNKRYPKVFGTLYLMGVLDEKDLPKVDGIYQPACNLKLIHWDRIPRYFTEPGAVIDEIYQWSTDFQTDLLFRRLALFLRAMTLPGGIYKQSVTVRNALGNPTADLLELRIPVLSAGIYPQSFSQVGLNLTPVEAGTGKKKGIAFIPYLVGTASLKAEINDDWEAELKTSVSLDAGLGLSIRPPLELEAFQNILTNPLGAGTLGADIFIRQKATANDQISEIFLFGDKTNTHLSVSGISAKFYGNTISPRPDAGAELEIKTINLLITTGEGDSFLSKVLPSSGIDATFGVDVGFSLLNGVYFKGSAGVEILLPTHIQLGPVDIQGIILAIRPKERDIPIEVSATIKAKLGPLQVVVENIGISSKISFPANSNGKLGPVDFKLAFKPPKGVGLAIDASAVKGGGYLYFDFDKEEYAGALELVIASFLTVTAIGLITTRMPDGSKGFSLLIIITAEFGTGIQIGMGFTLIGVGGLLGLNRSVRREPLVDGVRTGAVNNIMFPRNVVANAPRIISDLRAIFPPQEGIFLIGPMAKLGWGSPPLITLSLGVIIEIPGNLFILGVLKCILPDEKAPVLVLQVAFVGAIEFDKKRLWLFAVIFDSRILTFTIEGELGVLFAWGDDADFVLSVGGFHPRFTPPPLPFPSPKRLAISILDTDKARIRVSCYFAVTTNTVQFGARAELFFGFSAISVEGHFQFDALFQFSPFYFVIELSTSVALKVGGTGLLAISLDLALEGPTPWHAKGSGSIKILFFEISANFDETWGEEKDTTLPPIDVFPLLAEELAKAPNWSALPPTSGNLLVSLRVVGDKKEFVLHPVGALRVTQRAVPLNSTIDLFGSQKSADANRFTLAVTTPGLAVAKSVREEFAPAQFHALSRAEKLAAPAFSQEDGGVDISATGNAMRSSLVVRRVVRYEQIIIDTNFKRFQQRFVTFAGTLFRHFLGGNAAARSVLSAQLKNQMQPFKDVITTDAEGFGVANTSNNKLVAGAKVFGSYHAAKEHMEQEIAQNPGLAGKMHVVPDFELNKAA